MCVCSQCCADALAVQIARVGNSKQAKEFIHRLDVDPEIGLRAKSVGRCLRACVLCELINIML